MSAQATSASLNNKSAAGLSALAFLFALRLRSVTNKKSSNNASIPHAITFDKYVYRVRDASENTFVRYEQKIVATAQPASWRERPN